MCSIKCWAHGIMNYIAERRQALGAQEAAGEIDQQFRIEMRETRGLAGGGQDQHVLQQIVESTERLGQKKRREAPLA